MVRTRSHAKKTAINQTATGRTQSKVARKSQAKEKTVRTTVVRLNQSGKKIKIEPKFGNILRQNDIFSSMVVSQLKHGALVRLSTANHAMMEKANSCFTFAEVLDHRINHYNLRAQQLNGFIDLASEGKESDLTEVAAVVSKLESDLDPLLQEIQIIVEYISRNDNKGDIPEFEVFRTDEKWIGILDGNIGNTDQFRKMFVEAKLYFDLK